MLIDILKLKHGGKTSDNFEFQFLPNESFTLENLAVIDGPIKVNGTLQLHEDEVEVDGEISCLIVGKCARCLEKAVYNFKSGFYATFVRSNPNLDEDEYLYKRGVVDLTEPVRDFLLANMPSVIYCKDDCKGLCPVCGSNLNEEDCKCKY